LACAFQQTDPSNQLQNEIKQPEIARATNLSACEWLVIAISSAALFANTMNSKPLQSANDRSRWSTVWSLVHQGSFQIDDIDSQPNWRTIDKVRHNGHFYSTKPAILSTVTAAVYWVVHKTTGLNLFQETESTTRLILLIVNWLPMTIAFIVMGRLLLRCSESELVRILALSAFCFGSLVPSYATTLNNHSVAVVCLVFSLAFLFRVVIDARGSTTYERRGRETRAERGRGRETRAERERGRETRAERGRRTDFLWAGFWAALVPCNELPAALFGIAAFVLMLKASCRQTLRYFIPGALIPLVAYFVLNWMATGGWKPFYLYYGTEKYRYVFQGIPSYWMNPRGMDQSIDSPVVYFVHCVIGHHGIFSLSPIFLLLVCTLLRRQSWSAKPARVFIWLGFGLSVAVLGFYLTRTSNYNYGGNTFGLRWMLWLTPFWILGLVPALEWCVERRVRLAGVFVLLGISVFSSLSAARNPWGESWLFYQMKTAGWIDYSNPAPKFPFKRELHTWFSEIPQNDSVGVWVEFTSSGSASDTLGRRPDRLRLTDHGPQTKNGKLTREIEFKLTEGAGKTETIQLWFDTEAFYSGESVGQSIVAFESTGDHEWQQIYTLVRGIPTQRAYRPGVTRYVKTDLQDDYFTCQRAATQVTEDWHEQRNHRLIDLGAESTDRRRNVRKAIRTNTLGVRIRFRCDTWLCRDVPFGVVQFELSEFDARTGAPLSLRRFLLTDCSQ
jgi:hypothetical protein